MDTPIYRPIPDDTRPSKKLPIVVSWNDTSIHLGELEFLTDGSLVFESSLHSSKEAGATVSFGSSNFKDRQFKNHQPDSTRPAGNGFHISLHSPTKDRPGVMHFREHHPGEILYTREIDWFPVTKAFNLLRLYTLPIDICPISAKKPTVITKIDPRYKDSLEVVVDIFPRDTETHLPLDNSAVVWGFCPHYIVRLSLIPSGQRTAALIYWPEDNKLEL